MPTKTWDELMEDAQSAGASFEPLPRGDYDLVITKAEATQAKTSGNTMYKVTCEVESGPHAKRKVFNNFVVTPDNGNALSWFFRNMKTLGLNADFFRQRPSDEQVAQALLGRRFKGTVDIREWNGEERNELKNLAPARGAAPAGGPQQGGAPQSYGPSAPAPQQAPAPAPPAPQQQQYAPPPAPAPAPQQYEQPAQQGAQLPPPPPPTGGGTVIPPPPL